MGRVVLMPLMLLLMIKGLTVSAWATAKPFLALVLTPEHRKDKAPATSDKYHSDNYPGDFRP